MPKFSSQVDLLKIPVKNFAVEDFCLDIHQGGTGYSGDNTLVGLKTYLGIGSAANKYAEDLTKLEHGVPYVVEHNLGSTDVTYSLRNISTGDLVNGDVRVTGANTVTVTTDAGYADGDLRIVVIG